MLERLFAGKAFIQRLAGSGAKLAHEFRFFRATAGAAYFIFFKQA